MKNLSILGSTGSIGTQALEIARSNPKEFKIIGLTANNNIGLLKKQILEFKPEAAAVMENEKAGLLNDLLKKEDISIDIYSGIEGIIKIATLQATVEPGVYHIIFFEKLLSFIKSFRKKISQANLWIQSANKKAAKRRTFWGQVAKSGTQRLLSSEDYSQRSAG